ncbi:adenylate/guanylate cyclase domain-containing protein [Spirulina sp. CS-785/01]|uniref:adenylate/guanylate cyclase domain-containing protein n=1 Tax=Spirulina sp. CS-785/01 TaxID=3021716 RepID=UPI00232D06F2|nr:adenylate/guanylate cyclase domain-containing protein [Spirulina sp. CS-785/01]MDB9311634.1 adenylate/guanylate cyclase domain-containing protein [Spirulina sp. CS-785/01]
MVLKWPAKIPLRVILVLPFALQTTATVSLTAWLSVRNGEEGIQEYTRQLRGEVTARIQQQIQDYTESPYQVNQINRDAVQLQMLDLQDWAQLEDYFIRQLTNFPTISQLKFGNTEGEFLGIERLADGELKLAIANSTTNQQFQTYTLTEQGEREALLNTLPEYDVRNQSWYEAAVAAQQAVWGGIYTNTGSETLASPVNQPIYNDQEELLGVFGAEIYLSAISDFLQGLQISESGEAFIIERSGQLVASSTLDQPFLVTYGTTLRIQAKNSNDPLIQGVANYLQRKYGDLSEINSPQQLEFTLASEQQFLQVTPLQNDRGIDWLIVVVIPKADFTQRLDENTRNTVLLCLLALILSIFIGVLMAQGITKPLSNLIEASQAIARGKLQQTTGLSRISEVQLLARSFNQMSQQLSESFTKLEQANIELEKRVQQRTAKLTEAEAELRGLFSAMTELVMVKNKEGRYLKIASMNPYLIKDGMGELIGKTEYDLFPPEQAELFVQCIRDSLHKQEMTTIDYSVFYDDTQQKRWFSASISPISNDAVVWVARDITEPKQLQEELAKSQRFLDSLIDNIPLAVFVRNVKEDLRYVLWNKAAEKLYKIPEQEVLGKTSYDIFNWELAHEFEDNDRQLIQNKQLVVIEEELLETQFSGPIWQRLLKVPLIEDDGEVTHIVGIAEDITQRKLNEEAIKKNEEEFRHLVHNVNSAIVRWRFDGTILFINQFGLDFFGYQEDELIGQNLMGTIVPQLDSSGRKLAEELMNAFQTPEKYTVFENENMRKNGERVWVTWANQAIYDDWGNLIEFLSVATDTTERRLAEEALKAEKSRSERLLLNILPAAIAQKLKQETGLIAKQFPEVTILFADIVGFTTLSNRMSPHALVKLLNHVFSLFDRLVDWHGLEKIKTIGDAYMAVGGLPIPRKDHAEVVADLALDIQNAISSFQQDDGQTISLRIGIHTGSVVAGVIGIRKFSYDLWGDTVNVASRMESHGEAGKIQITEATYHCLKEKYYCEERGMIEVRGKGRMKTYWLISRHS